MGKCVGCGKSGLFLKLNDKHLCSDCEEKQKKTELSTREVANIQAKYICDIAKSIQDTVENMGVMAEDCGAYSNDVMEKAVAMLTTAVEAAKRAAAVVRNPDVSKIAPTIAETKKTVEDMHAKTLELMGEAKY